MVEKEKEEVWRRENGHWMRVVLKGLKLGNQTQGLGGWVKFSSG